MRALLFAPCVLFMAGPVSAQSAPPVASVTIAAVGDSGYVAGNALFGAPPADWVETHLKNLEPFRNVEVKFLNLEGAVTRTCKRFYDKEFQFGIAPSAVAQFARWGFNLFGLANNHSQDCLEPSSASEALKAQQIVRDEFPDIALHGVAANLDALSAPAIITVKGVRIGMVAMKGWGGGKNDNMGNADNRHELLRALRDAAVDVRILSLHGGTESVRQPHDAIVALAREFLASYDGDIVFAHHPHVMQGMELLRRAGGRTAAIFYSLGNFLHNGLSDRGDGLLAHVSVGKAGLDPDSVAAFPLANANTFPGPLAKSDLARVLTILRGSSTVAQSRKLPAGLTRVPFVFEQVLVPAPGYRLISGSAHGAVRSPRKVRGARNEPAPNPPPSRWIPPKTRVPTFTRNHL